MNNKESCKVILHHSNVGFMVACKKIGLAVAIADNDIREVIESLCDDCEFKYNNPDANGGD